VCRNKEEKGLEEVYGIGFDPGLVVNEDRYEKRKEYDVANDNEWQIGDGTLAKVGEGDATHGKQKDIGE
jgi:hypothetical protein